jgi:NAD(P)-dependent dehydrogenase (short-subunit alcohol dehydrogenase family)
MKMEQRRKALVTGSSTGIGRSIALKLGQEGYDVAVHYSKTPDGAKEVADKIAAFGAKAIIVSGDMGDANVPERVVTEAIEGLGGLDLLVNNAGFTRFEKLVDITAECMDSLYYVDFRGMILCAKYAARHMIDSSKGGNILFNTSVRGFAPHVGDAVYGGFKAGLNRAIRSFALELGPYGIRVNGFAPGITWARMHAQEQKNSWAHEFYGNAHRYVPLRRYGTPDDMADVVLWLDSPGSSYVTGDVIKVDGGVTSVGGIERFDHLSEIYLMPGEDE